MVMNRWYLMLLFFVSAAGHSLAQCNQLRPQRDVSFNTDQDCAPVTVTQFTITYYFNIPQDPARIRIRYVWNDPLGTVSEVHSGNGLTAGAGNTSFTATAGLTYNDNNGQCNILPTAYILFDNQPCTSSEEQRSAYFWGTDEQANGILAMAPQTWDVCHDNPIAGARFRDASDFNCNRTIEPDNPNNAQRHVQFVYGTNHNPATAIRDLSLNDGGVVPLTDGNGALVSTTTVGTVTGAYFGPVEAIPAPADGPVSLTFPMNAPANPDNLVGDQFEVTMYNWNVCNPYDPQGGIPNYEDAIATTGYIRIVDSPRPDFVTRDANGNAASAFCIGDLISFRNTTTASGGFNFFWEFFDDATGTDRIHTSGSRHTDFAFTSGGTKLIRLHASNPTAQGSCVAHYDRLVEITPSLVARIGVTDHSGNPITPDFCQESTTPLTDFEVRFTDTSIGSPTTNTEWRWEFFNEGNASNNPDSSEPAGNGFSSTPLGPFDHFFTNPGVYRARLIIRDGTTDCRTQDEVRVRVFEKPQPEFTAPRVCEGSATTITDASILNSVGGAQIVSWEWDLDYDGVTFNKNTALDNQQTITHTYPSSGTYQVALRVATDVGGCFAMISQAVEVDPLPVATIAANITSGCSALDVTFTNNSVNGQPDVIKDFIWEVDDGGGFVVDAVQHPSDPDFSDTFVRTFTNTGSFDRVYNVRLRVVTVNDCELVSAPIAITVNPEPRAGFVSLNYSPFNNNCSPVSVNFSVDNQTQALNPTDYTWRIEDAIGLVDEVSTGTTPVFTHDFDNTTQSIKDYFVTLRATLPSSCYGDSTRIIRVAPVPPSDFDVQTISYGCDRVLLGLDAAQRGLTRYEWTISINGFTVYASTTDGDHVEYEIQRSATTDQNVAISLTTTNSANCESPLTTQNLFVPRTQSMNTSFTATPVDQTLPSSTVTLVNTTTPGPWTYLWDFGDGTTSTDPLEASHTYLTYGVYTITLQVANNDCVETFSRDIRINPIPPVIEFDYFPPSGCAPHTVTFVNQSQYADPTSYVWKFGANEGTSYATDPTYTYHQPGLYSVTLSATNMLGGTVSLTKEFIIEVLPNPVAQFAVYPTTTLNVPGETLYTDNRSRDATEYLWDFGDGSTSTDPEPQHKYNEEGTFTVTLIARNADGCADTTALVSGVNTVKHGQLLIPNAFVPNPAGPGSGDVRNNQVFLPLMQNVTKFQLMIFNRWGELMFESTNPDSGWDGYYKGRLCAQDVYIYRLTVEYDNGRTITRTGDINLLR